MGITASVPEPGHCPWRLIATVRLGSVVVGQVSGLVTDLNGATVCHLESTACPQKTL